MGCGQSKSDPERQARISKLIPPLRLRRNEGSSINLSKKELLKHGVHQEDDQSLSNCHSDVEIEIDKKSEASREGSARPPAQVEENKESKADNLAEKKEDKVDKLEEMTEEKAGKLDLEEKKDQEKAMLAKETDEQEKKGENEDESEGEGKLSECYLFLEGSPSFRVYCVDQSLENVKDDTESKKDIENESDQDLQVVDSHIAASVDSNEVLGKTKKKGKKGKGFGRVMGKAKTGAVKNLFNVNSCYHRSHHDGARLLAQN